MTLIGLCIYALHNRGSAKSAPRSGEAVVMLFRRMATEARLSTVEAVSTAAATIRSQTQ